MVDGVAGAVAANHAKMAPYRQELAQIQNLYVAGEAVLD